MGKKARTGGRTDELLQQVMHVVLAVGTCWSSFEGLSFTWTRARNPRGPGCRRRRRNGDRSI